MSKTLSFIATHIINKAVISEYLKMSKVKNIDVILVVDNSNLKIETNDVIEEKEFFGTKVKCLFFDEKIHDTLNLPYNTYDNKNSTFSKVMWYNADYRYYYVKYYLPDYDYYWEFDYDVYCNGEYQPFFDRYKDRKEDLLIIKYREEKQESKWYWKQNIDWVYKNSKIYGGFYPVSRVSNRACDFLYSQRMKHTEIFNSADDNKEKWWIFSELFVPTEITNNGYSAFDIDEDGIILKKEYDLNDTRLFENPDNKLYHPVKGQFLERLNKLKTEKDETIHLLNKRNDLLKSRVKYLEDEIKNQRRKLTEQIKMLTRENINIKKEYNAEIKALTKQLKTPVKGV